MNNASRSNTFTAPNKAADNKNQNYICWTDKRFPAKQNIYGPTTRIINQNHNSIFWTTGSFPSRCMKIAPEVHKPHAPRSKTLTAPQMARNNRRQS